MELQTYNDLPMNYWRVANYFINHGHLKISELKGQDIFLLARKLEKMQFRDYEDRRQFIIETITNGLRKH